MRGRSEERKDLWAVLGIEKRPSLELRTMSLYQLKSQFGHLKTWMCR